MWFRKSLLIALSAILAAAQTPSPATRSGFEVVSIRPSAPGAPEGSVMMRQLGHGVLDVSYPLTLVIQLALHAKPFEITGAPAWVASARYDISAKTPEPATSGPDVAHAPAGSRRPIQNAGASREERDAGLRALRIEERKTSRAKGRNLLRARSGGPSTAAGSRSSWRASSATLRQHHPSPAARRAILIRREGSHGNLGIKLGRPARAAGGRQDWDYGRIRFRREICAGRFHARACPASSARRDPRSHFQHLRAALQDQLKLKVKSPRDPVEVIVIDRIERPTDN